MTKKLSKEKNNKNNFFSLSGNIIFSTLGFVSFFILVRTLEKQEMGKWVLYVALSAFIEMLRFGITKFAVIRFSAGADEEEKKAIFGTNWILGLAITMILSALVWIPYFFFATQITAIGFEYFFIFYPFLAFLNLPFNNALTVLQSRQRFDIILYLRTFNIGIFVLFLLINGFILKLGIIEIIIAHLLVNFFTSLIVMLYKWDELSSINKFSWDQSKKILHFGKFTSASLIGNNLLKSADTFIIGFAPFLGTKAIALYSVPMKLIELLEIPLRSFAATLFPVMSEASRNNNNEIIRKLFIRYTLTLTGVFVIFSIFAFFFSEEMIWILAGEQYISASPLFIAISIYGIFLPCERFSGVALDSMNKPHKNLVRIMIMLAINIIGDIIAIYVFKSLIMVATVSIVMGMVGAVSGLLMLKKNLRKL